MMEGYTFITLDVGDPSPVSPFIHKLLLKARQKTMLTLSMRTQ